MIKIEKYDKKVEDVYFDAVKAVVDDAYRKKIVNRVKKYMGAAWRNLAEQESDEIFRKWILADYSEIKKAYLQLSKDEMHEETFKKNGKFKRLYQIYYEAYNKVRGKIIRMPGLADQKLNVYLVKNSKIKTCPYCNRNYITARGENVSGAQLDHFISRSEYPIFALCLYNLVPCCSVCNLTKLTKELEVSPFASEMDDNSFTFTPTGILPGEQPAVKIKAKNAQLEKNIEVLHLQEAYDFHSDDLKELVELKEMYPDTQISEICDLINGERRLVGKANLTSTDIRDMVFGKQVPYEEYGKKPLAKFRHDILKDLGVYTR